MVEIFKNSKRIHDEFYLKEKIVVKESVKFLFEEIKRNHNDNFSLIDIGCATGIFISYINQKLPNVKITAVDLLESLLEKAKINCPSADLYQLDIYDKDSVSSVLKDKKFDAVVLDGVHPIFDDVKPWIENLTNIVTDSGMIYVFGSFNDSPYDVVTRIKSVGSNIWEKGWNRLSLETCKREFEKNNFSVKFKKFNIDLEIKKTDDDRRTYTQRLDDGSIITRNGLELISTPYLISCKKNI